MRAYDFDGTISIMPWESKVNQHPPIVANGFYINPHLDPSDVKIVLTGNYVRAKQGIETILISIGCRGFEVICNPKPIFSFDHLAKWKARVMRERGITEYVDDDPYFCDILKEVWDGRCMTVEETRG